MLDGALTAEMVELWRQDYSVLVAARLNNMWTKAAAAGPGGQPVLDNVLFEFNTQTPGILNWIKDRGANFVTACMGEQQEAIAALLTKKMRESHTVDELARMIRPCIGLTEGQATANARYYDSIVANLRKEHPRMNAESIRQKAREAAHKYAEKQHRERAYMIAQTESAFAYNRGADEGIRQAQEQNLIGLCKKRWSTSGDDAVCKTCASLEGTEVDMDESFDFGVRTLFVGQKLLPPAHPRCACAVEYIEIEKALSFAEESQIQENGELPYNIEEKESELQNLKAQSQAMGEEMNQKINDAIASGDIEAIQEISMKYGPEMSRIVNEVNALQSEINNYKARLGGHLTADDFWSGLPTEYLNKWSYESDTSMRDVINDALLKWSGEGYKDAKYSEILEEVIALSTKKYSGGSLYRGMTLPSELLDNLQVGKEIMQNGLSSWSTSRDIAMQFAYTNKNPVLLIDVTKGKRDALSIKAFSHIPYEDEVLYSGNARLQIVNRSNDTIEYSFQGKKSSKEVTIIEVQEIR